MLRIDIIKDCEVCGAEMSRKFDEQIGNFRNRRTCGKTCRRLIRGQTWKAKRGGVPVPDSRDCEQCAKAFERRTGESVCNYLKRRSCGKVCLTKLQTKGRKNALTALRKISVITERWASGGIHQGVAMAMVREITEGLRWR